MIVSGGITRSPVWLQLLCDVLGRKIIAHTGIDASAAGASRLGFEALNIGYKSPKANATAYTPNMITNALYEKHFYTFKEIYNRLKDLKLQL